MYKSMFSQKKFSQCNECVSNASEQTIPNAHCGNFAGQPGTKENKVKQSKKQLF